MTNTESSHAKKLARALEAEGITGDTPEETPNPFWAAQEAFYLCQGQRSARAWRELRDWLTGPGFPRAEYYRKQAEYCSRALRRPNLPEDLRKPIHYAWGYLDGIAFALRRAESGPSKPQN